MYHVSCIILLFYLPSLPRTSTISHIVHRPPSIDHFLQIGPIKSFHGVPRFGHSSDITDIFTDDGSVDINKVLDYVMGSIFIAAFMMASYLLFVFLVAILKVCFGKQAGILSGHPFVEDKSIVFDKPPKNTYFRSFLLLLTAGVVTGGFIFLIKGTQKVKEVASDVRDGTKVRMRQCDQYQ